MLLEEGQIQPAQILKNPNNENSLSMSQAYEYYKSLSHFASDILLISSFLNGDAERMKHFAEMACCSVQSLASHSDPRIREVPRIKAVTILSPGLNHKTKIPRELSSDCKRERKRRGGKQEDISVSGKCMSHTGLELYRGIFTNRNDPITRNYQHTHGKVAVTKRPSQLFFSGRK